MGGACGGLRRNRRQRNSNEVAARLGRDQFAVGGDGVVPGGGGAGGDLLGIGGAAQVERGARRRGAAARAHLQPQPVRTIRPADRRRALRDARGHIVARPGAGLICGDASRGTRATRGAGSNQHAGHRSTRLQQYDYTLPLRSIKGAIPILFIDPPCSSVGDTLDDGRMVGKLPFDVGPYGLPAGALNFAYRLGIFASRTFDSQTQCAFACAP